MEDVSNWHRDWLASVGLHLPSPVLEAMVDVDPRGKFESDTRGQYEHRGDNAERAGGEAEATPT